MSFAYFLLCFFYLFSDLDFWTDYEIRVAAYTDQLVDGDGVGPFSVNITGKTMESGTCIFLVLSSELT